MSCPECGTPKCHCKKNACASPAAIEIKNPSEIVNFRKVVVPASVGDETTNPPKVGAYSNVILQYEATGTTYIYSSECIPTLISNFSDIAALWKAIEDEEGARKDADQEIWTEIETIEASSDVVDVVGTYAELQAYDTSKLHNNDLIKVLQDETRDDAITYYRWSTSTNTFTYVGAEGPYYTASETDVLLAGKQDTLIAGDGISIAADGKTISVSGVAANTIFYMNASEHGATRHIYKKPDMTDPASSKDVFDANELGQVILRISTSATPDQYSDCYLQNAYKATGDYQLLFLDEKTYRSFDTTNLTDTTFVYGTRVLQSELTAGTNVQINGTTISATDTTYSAFTGATSSVAGTSGLVPAPAAGDEGKFLQGDGTWGTLPTPATSTTFYATDSWNLIYKDSGMTTLATGQDIIDAVGNGIVYVSRTDSGVEHIYILEQSRVFINSVEFYLSDDAALPTMIMLSFGNKASSSFNKSSIDLQKKLTAGTNISISGTTISVTGMPVLYTTQGQNEDGAVTQKLFTDTVGDVETILQILNSGNGV